MTSLQTLVAEELAAPVDPRVSAMAGAIAALYPGAARAVASDPTTPPPPLWFSTTIATPIA